jgi:hypothetical protein
MLKGQVSKCFRALDQAAGLQSLSQSKGETMTEVDKRAYVAALYPGPGWKTKVRKMSDAQVTAIYLRESSKPPKPKSEPKNDKPKESGEDDIPF